MRLKKSYMLGFLLCALTGLLLGGCSSSSNDNPAPNVINLNTVNGVVSSPIFSDPITKNADGTLTTPSSTDIMWVDPIGGHIRVYDTDRGAKNAADLLTFTGRVWVIDTQTDQVLFQIKGFYGKHSVTGLVGVTNNSGPNGVMVANDTVRAGATGAKELWAGDGDSSLRWADLTVAGVPTIGGAIKTGGKNRADELAYDPDHDIIMVGNDADSPVFLTFVNRATKAVVGKINYDTNSPTGSATPTKDVSLMTGSTTAAGVITPGHGPNATGGIEQPVYDAGFFYQAVPSTTENPQGEIDKIDPVAMKVVARYPVATPGAAAGSIATFCTPHGLALGPSHQLMIACGDKVNMIVKVINDQTGAIVADIPQIGATDMAWFNVGNMKYYVGAGSFLSGGVLTPSIGVIDALTNKWERNIPTGSVKDGKSVTVNPETNHIYAPVSDVGPGGIEVFQ